MPSVAQFIIAAAVYSLYQPPSTCNSTVCSGGGGNNNQAHAFSAPTATASLYHSSSSSRTRGHHHSKQHHHQDWSPLSSSINDIDEDEWRAFRARLVQNGLPSLDNTKKLKDDDSSNTTSKSKDGTINKNSNTNNQLRYAHECTPLVEVGSILLSIPTTDLCQAVEQQYWHRAVVLITKVSENLVSGNVELDVPEEQLAQGLKRGRWSYRGLLLNRCTTTSDGEWSIQRGGDLLGLDSADGTEFVCLHNFNDRLDSYEHDISIREASTRLVGNLSYISLEDAQNLCKKYPDKYNPKDFMTLGGFCSWRPGQLEREMGDERNEWVVLSVDGQSIWDELQLQRQQIQSYLQSSSDNNKEGKDMGSKLLAAGTEMWRNFLSKIDLTESTATERLPKGQLNFYDRMLEVWAEDNLNIKKEDDEESNDSSCSVINDSSSQIGSGTIVRAKSPPSNDMLLYDAEFIRSIVLVLEDTPHATVGILLNHPMSAAIEVKDGEDPLPIRYGGPIDVPSWRDGSYREGDVEEDGDDDEEEMYEGFLDYQNNGVAFEDLVFDDVVMGEDFGYSDDSDDSSFIWISKGSPNGISGGTQLGTSNLWLHKEDEAIDLIQSGFLKLEDVMVFTGVCIWEKGMVGRCNGGLREQVDALQSLEVVRACDDHSDYDGMERVWGILSARQDVLTEDSLDCNIRGAIDAWEALAPGGKPDSSQSDNALSRVSLSEAALKAWLGINLLEDPLGTFVEVKDDQRRELSGH